MVQQNTYGTPRADLGEALMEYRLSPTTMVGRLMLPVFGTRKKAATFSAITRESLLRRRKVKRAPKGAFSRDSFDAADISYECIHYGHEQPLDDEERQLYMSDFDAEMTSIMVAENVLETEQEIRIAAKLFDTAVFTGADLYTDNSGAPWDAAASDVIGQVQAAKEQVRQNCGLEVNSMVISTVQFNNLKNNTGILDRTKYTQTLTDAMIASLIAGVLGIENLQVGKGVYNAAAEGQDYSGTDIWSDDYAFLGVTAKSQNLSEPCIGRTMLWTDNTAQNIVAEQYREEQTTSEIYRARQHTDEKVFDPYFGHLLKIDA